MNQEDLYNKSGYWTFLVTLALNVLFFAYISFIHPGTPANPGSGSGLVESK
ncbi:hypothetical protein [Leptospira idonii]|uniref:hypothetical protein n=1 Tax=Leptospira idonii TaxID=1193500 RepID=UPI001438623A|nr:hypothetical protein [Leptospira idonii]